LGCTSAPLLAHAYFGQYSRYYADDFCFRVQLTSKGILGGMSYYYNGISGRYSDLFIELISGIINTNVLYGSYTFILIWFAILVFTIYLLCGKQNLIYYLLLASTILFATFDLLPNMYFRRVIDSVSHTWDSYPSIFQSLYWISGRNRFVIPLVLGTILSGVTAHYTYRGYRIKEKPYILIFAALLSFFAGGFGETYVVMQTTLLALFLILIYYWGSNRFKKRLVPFLGVVLLFSILSMVFIIISPGNENRASYFTQPSNISELLLIACQSTAYILKNIFKWPGNIMTIIQLIGISMYVGISNNKIKNITKSYVIKKFIIILPFLIFILLFASFLPAAYGISKAPPPRVMITPIYFILCLISLWGFLIGRYLNYRYRIMNKHLFSFFIILLFSLFSLNGIRDTLNILKKRENLKSFSIAFDNREKQILDAKLIGEGIIYVPEIKHFIGGAILTCDSTFWVNECISDYYGITVIANP